ncbi:asparagine synthase-related protein [Streptomyces sp. NPDC004082]|uniref:asparagine synthase-related protein n=1 Tax=unclassified Streptomyces TaxID=2593676 RepID=UPI0033B1008B
MPDGEVLVSGIGVRDLVEQGDHRLPDQAFAVRATALAAVADLLPAPVLERRKSPYPMVRDPAYRTTLTQQVGRLLAGSGSPATDLLDTEAVRSLLLEPCGPDRFPREGLEFVLDLDQWLRTHRPALHL